MRHHRLTRERSLARVPLAVYWLADDSGFYCEATDTEIARAAKCSTPTAKSCLLELESNGDIRAYRHPEGRYVLLTDSPTFQEMARQVHCGTEANPEAGLGKD